jgi:hypothetical protein
MFNRRIRQDENLHGQEVKMKGGTMICPHCTVSFHIDSATEYWLTQGNEKNNRYIYKMTCPSCKEMILVLSRHHYDITRFGLEEPHQIVLYPKHGSTRKPCPPEVKAKSPALAQDYLEACQCLEVSPKASAALSRRCLQQILRENENIPKISKGPDNQLTDEIKYVIGLNKLSSRLAGKLDHVRHVGNFAAHPTKDVSTGAVVDVEEGEAEYNLEVLEDLFDAYYVEPQRDAQRKADLNKKLQSAGKKPIP